MLQLIHISKAIIYGAVVLVLLCLKEPTAIIVSAENSSDNVLDLNALMKYDKLIRQGDYMLVRATASPETAEQQTIVCPGIIDSLVSILVSEDQQLEVKDKAAEVLALCTTDNPENRKAIGEANGGKVFIGLVEVIRVGHKTISDYFNSENVDGDDDEAKKVRVATRAIGSAAEAIWILTFGSAQNHEGFMKAGAIDTLAGFVLSQVCAQDCSRSIMWSFAALQNLAANYCSSEEHGPYCWWHWKEAEVDGNLEQQLKVNTVETPIIVDAQAARNQILTYKDGNGSLLEEIILWVCEGGPVGLRHHDYFQFGDIDGDEDADADVDYSADGGYWYAWPSRALIQHEETEQYYKDDEFSPSIISWAAIGVIKNLALAGPEARELIRSSPYDIDYCLCRHHLSPDWLEGIKSEDALDYLEVLACPPVYDEDCEDLPDWVAEEDDLTCLTYEEENLCVELGHLMDSQGIPADSACCICGGGIYDEDREFGNGYDYEDEEYDDGEF